MKSLPNDHPLRKAQWIWPNHCMYLYNHFAHFRRDFELAGVPERAPFFITADKAYKLYVNGDYVCRGPARGYASHWPFDEVDLHSYLRAGKNWIAVEAYNPGISTFQYIHQTSAGFLCAAVWGDFCLVSDRQWKMRRSPAHARETARYSLQIDFQEHVDARLDTRDWISSPEAPADWEANLFPEGSQQHLSFPFGRAPYTTVEERGIPLLRETRVVPERVAAHTSGPHGEGYRTWRNVSWGFVREVAKAKWDAGADFTGQRTDEGFVLTLPACEKGVFTAVSLLLPSYTVGTVGLSVKKATGHEIIDLHFHECMNGTRPAIHNPGAACLTAMANRIFLRKGLTEHEFYHALGFRVVTLVGRDLTVPLEVRIAVRSMGYPFTMRGAFSCSDETLNQIHAISRHTQQICSLDAYVDTPWREQAQWWGDARVQAKNTFFLDGDARLLKRGIRSIAGQRTDEGLTYGHAPTCAYGCILPDFALTWILTIRDYYFQTGDISLFIEQLPRIREVLSYFDLPEARHPNGLLRYDRRFWLFEDWSTLYKGEIPTFLNLWFIETLNALAELASVAGMKDAAKVWRADSDVHSQKVVENLFDPAMNLMIGGLDEQLLPVKEASVHDQTLALHLGLCPEAHETMIQEKLLPFLREEPMDGPIPSAFWSTYVFEEMGNRGYGDEVLRTIRKKWSPMLATGTTWENFEWRDGSDGGTVSHAWTAHPSFHLVQILAGITQTAPAWKSIRFSPYFTAGVDHAQALIPSPRGDIAASWKRVNGEIAVRLSIPADMIAECRIGDRHDTLSGPAELDIRVPDRCR